jgi:HpcH/HpaI aldolase/citrate lyase family
VVGYFKQARPRLFRRLDQFIRRRLRAVLRKQEKRPSMGRSGPDHARWTNAFFADQGLFTFMQPMTTRDTPDEETSDWRAVCGKTVGLAHDDYRMAPPTETMAKAAARTLLIAQIETTEGLNEVEAIAGTPGIDVVWLGHFDLSNFMGIPAQFRHADFIAAAQRIGNAAKAHGKIAGVLATDQAWAEEYWAYGYRMLAYGLDHQLFQGALREGLRGLAEGRSVTAGDGA